MRHVAAAALSLSLVLPACSISVEGDTDPSYGEVTLTVASYDDQGAELSRDERSGPGDELVGPLDRELHDPIEVDGAEVSDPSGLLAAHEARIGGVLLTREQGGVLRATGDSPLEVRSAWRTGATLTISVDGARFEVTVGGAVGAASVDRILATSLVRLVRGEALLADDCRPDCLYLFGLPGFLCEPIRDQVEGLLGAECAGPFTPEEWSAIEQGVRDGKRDTCYDLWYVPRPLCEWMYDQIVENGLPYLRPDEGGQVCAGTFYDRCTGGV